MPTGRRKMLKLLGSLMDSSLQEERRDSKQQIRSGSTTFGPAPARLDTSAGRNISGHITSSMLSTDSRLMQGIT
jgi:hypothetical protein